MSPLVDLVRRSVPQLSAYTVASVVALGVDLAFYQSLTVGGVRPVTAGAVAYLLGGVVHYILSARFVFDVSASRKALLRRLAEFWASGMVGLAITAVIVWLGAEVAGAPPMLAKLAAVGFSFVAMFLVRRNIVFAPSPDTARPLSGA